MTKKLMLTPSTMTISQVSLDLRSTYTGLANCQALVPILVPLNPNPKPKAVPNQKVQLGLGLTLESLWPPIWLSGGPGGQQDQEHGVVLHDQGEGCQPITRRSPKFCT